MKKPKVGDIVIFSSILIWPHCSTELKEYKVLSISDHGFYVEAKDLTGGQFYVFFEDDFEIKQPEKPDYLSIFSLVAVIAIVLLLIFSSVYFKL